MKNERGSITLFVLVSMLFFLIIATTAYVSASSKLQGQNEEIARIKASYEQDLSDDALLQLYNRATKTREWLPGNGTQEDTYKIYTIEDLVTFSMRSNNGDFIDEGTGEARYIYVELMNDLDFNSDSSYEKATRTDFGDVNEDGTVQDLKTELTTGQGFPCIAVTDTNVFEGNFEGNDHEIRNLHIRNSSNAVTSIGLFSWIGNSSINNLGITGNITATVAETSGGIAGTLVENTTCTINNCHNGTTVMGLTNVAGIVGRVNGMTEIKNCYNDGNITSTVENVTSGVYVGGIIGRNLNQATITNCNNVGSVKSLATNASAIICNGGITGYMKNGTIQNCYNTGRIEEGNRVGGILGIAYGSSTSIANTKVINCYNTGKIDAIVLSDTVDGPWRGRCAGLIGMTWYANAEAANCYNIGDVTAIFYTGGIITESLYSNLDIINCYNQGNVTSEKHNASGIIGHNANESILTIANSYNIGNVYGANKTIAVCYRTSGTATITNTYYLDNVSVAVEGITPDPTTQMTQAQMQASSFVDTLNANKSSINLADYGLSEYTLSSWKQGEDGYPVFDW